MRHLNRKATRARARLSTRQAISLVLSMLRLDRITKQLLSSYGLVSDSSDKMVRAGGLCLFSSLGSASELLLSAEPEYVLQGLMILSSGPVDVCHLSESVVLVVLLHLLVGSEEVLDQTHRSLVHSLDSGVS